MEGRLECTVGRGEVLTIVVFHLWIVVTLFVGRINFF